MTLRRKIDPIGTNIESIELFFERIRKIKNATFVSQLYHDSFESDSYSNESLDDRPISPKSNVFNFFIFPIKSVESNESINGSPD